ncbi:hypothetical protein [Coleofasciculus sp. H7-2]
MRSSWAKPEISIGAKANIPGDVRNRGYTNSRPDGARTIETRWRRV